MALLMMFKDSRQGTMNSATVLTGTDGFTIMIRGSRSKPATGAMSRMKLKLSLS